MRGVRAGAAGGLLLILVPAEASGHGRFPEANGIVFSPVDRKLVVARTTFAVLPSTDEGATWSYLCLEGLGLSSFTFQDPELALTANGSLMAGLLAPVSGLDVSKDLGCSWSCAGGSLAGLEIVDTVVRPGAPDDVLVLARSLDDGGATSQIFESHDDGESWALVAPPFDSTATATGIAVSASDASRLYVSGTRGYGASRTASLFLLMQTDAGLRWVEHAIPGFSGTPASGEASILLGGVDPTDPDRIYLRSSANANGGVSRLYVTTDSGATFVAATEFDFDAGNSGISGALLALALSPDGSKVFVGTKESGLWSAARGDLKFTQVNPNVGVQCLATRQTASGPELWACGNEYKGPPGNPGNFIIGRSVDDGVTFESKLPTLTSLKGIAQCVAPSSGSMACGVQSPVSCMCDDYVSFCSGYETPNACLGCGMGGADAGAGDAGASDASGVEGGAAADAGKTGGAALFSSCGCRTVGTGDSGGAAVALGLAAGLSISLRRRRRRGRCT
jgi:hypothetical protein